MADEEKQKNLRTVIEENVIQSGTVFGIPIRNIIEGIFGCFIVYFIVAVQIPFITSIKQALTVFFCVLVFYINIHGIKNRSVTEFIFDEMKYHSRVRRLHLRSPEWHRNTYRESDALDNESVLQEGMRKFKESIEKFAAKYRTDGGKENNA